MNAPKQRGLDAASERSASRTGQRSRLRRTLFIAGVFVLLAMAYVPTPRHGYRFIFSERDTSIASSQLLVNVGFAALLGAILATIMPKAWRWITGIALIALLIIGGVEWRNFTEAAASRARSDEEYADRQLADHDSDAARFALRNGAQNWRLALRFDQAARVERKLKEWEGHAFLDEIVEPAQSPSPLPSPNILSTDPNAGEPIPRAQPVRSPSPR